MIIDGSNTIELRANKQESSERNQKRFQSEETSDFHYRSKKTQETMEENKSIEVLPK